MQMQPADSYRVVLVELACEAEKMRVSGSILLSCSMKVPGTRAEVEGVVKKLEELGPVRVQYPTDWHEMP